MNSEGFSVVTVTLKDREDGGLFVFSDDLPGLILSGADKAAVCECIVPAMRALIEHAGTTVVIHSEKPIAEILQLKSPRVLDMHVQRFIVEFKSAA